MSDLDVAVAENHDFDSCDAAGFILESKTYLNFHPTISGCCGDDFLWV